MPLYLSLESVEFSTESPGKGLKFVSHNPVRHFQEDIQEDISLAISIIAELADRTRGSGF